MKGKFALHKSTESSLCNSFRMPFRRFALGVMLVLIVVLYFDAAELRRRFLTDDQVDVVRFEDMRDQWWQVSQEDVDLLSMWGMYKWGNNTKKEERGELIRDMILHRAHLDASIYGIGLFLFGPETDLSVLKFESGTPDDDDDDLNCLESMVRLFEASCGSLTVYGLKHVHAFANICDAGVSPLEMGEACRAVCDGPKFAKWSPLTMGYTL